MRGWLIKDQQFGKFMSHCEEFRGTSYGSTICICISNHMFGREIWDKLPKCIFGNFEILQFQTFQKLQGEPNAWSLVNWFN